MSTNKMTTKALHLATHSGWYRFEQQGENWVQVDRALTYWQMSCIQVDPEDPKRAYIGTEHSGLFITNDGGKEWTRANPNVPCLTLSSMLALPGQLLVGTMPAALYCKANGGWQEIKGVRQGAIGGTFPPNPDLAPRTRVLTKGKKPGSRLYAGIEVGGILVSDDDGESWQSANDGLTDVDIHQILSSNHIDGLVVAACGEGVSRSMDHGAHWEKVTPAGNGTYGNALAEDMNGLIYLGITRDRPRTWTRPGRADSAIYKTSDGGAHWDLVTEDMSGGVMDICAAPSGDGVLVATAEGEVLSVNQSVRRMIISGLPCITAMALGA
jgi:photosystem II stability/assembly factor-like uncharacterized protein